MKPFTKIAAVFFTLGVLFHAGRLIFGWEIKIDGHVMPWGASIFGVIVSGTMAWGLFRESR